MAFVLDQSRTVSRLQGPSLLDASRHLIKTLRVFRLLVAVLALQFASGFMFGMRVGVNPFVAATALVGGPMLLAVIFRRLGFGRKGKRSKA